MLSTAAGIGYCAEAMLYDEQPTKFKQSWNQRKRWARGYAQVFVEYGNDMIKSILRGSLPPTICV